MTTEEVLIPVNEQDEGLPPYAPEAYGGTGSVERPSWWCRVGRAALVYLGPLLLIELIARGYLVWGGLPWNSTLSTYQNDDLLGYKPNPRFFMEGIRFNSMGFRADREYAASPGPDTVRVLAVGGSTTFGSGPNIKDAFPAKLEEVVRRASRTWEVINAGVSGWQLFQVRHSLTDWISEVHPDLVLFNEGWNTGSKPYRYYRNDDLITYPLFKYSLIFRLVDRRLRLGGWSLHYQPFLSTRAEMLDQQQQINDAPAIFDDYEQLVRACVEVCRGAGSTPVFVIPPGNLPDDWAASPTVYFRGSAQERRAPEYGEMCLAVNRTRDLSAERIFKVQKEFNFEVIDARRVFDGVDRSERQALFYDEIHPSPAGNERLAEFVSVRLPVHPGTRRR